MSFLTYLEGVKCLDSMCKIVTTISSFMFGLICVLLHQQLTWRKGDSKSDPCDSPFRPQILFHSTEFLSIIPILLVLQGKLKQLPHSLLPHPVCKRILWWERLSMETLIWGFQSLILRSGWRLTPAGAMAAPSRSGFIFNHGVSWHNLGSLWRLRFLISI